MKIYKLLRNLLKKHNDKNSIDRDISKIYYRKLFKSSFLVSIVPLIVIGILVVYERLTLEEAALGVISVLFGSTFFAKPYFDDLSSLTSYVDLLALNKKPQTPSLSFLGNIEELSEAVKNLQHSWSQRQLELEVAIAESRILFNTMPDILLMLDKDLKIIRSNKLAFKRFDKKIVGKYLHNIIKNPDLLEATQNTLSSSNKSVIETGINKNNNSHNYLVTIDKFPVKSIEGVEVVLLMHDITESTQRKQMMRDFVANASHEIRTPLTSIIGFIENLQTMGDSSDEVQMRKQFLKIMEEQAERISSLVNELLSLSKIERDKSTKLTQEVDLTTVIDNVTRRLSFFASQKDMEIKAKYEDNLPAIIGDFEELTQLFTNLVSNAIKYGKKSTNIDICAEVTKDFQPSEQIPQNCTELLVISVKDYGEGIEAEHLPRLTERFYRVDKVRSRKIGGNGLGLAIVKHVLIHHKGDLVIESEPGQGSNFTVRLPILNDDDPDSFMVKKLYSPIHDASSNV